MFVKEEEKLHGSDKLIYDHSGKKMQHVKLWILLFSLDIISKEHIFRILVDLLQKKNQIVLFLWLVLSSSRTRVAERPFSRESCVTCVSLHVH